MGQQLGTYLKTSRQGKKISAKALAAKAGISKSYLDYIESGAREPQVDTLAKIAVALELPLETMLNIQKKEQLETAMIRMHVDRTQEVDEDVLAVARTGDSEQSLDAEAFSKTLEAFRSAPDDRAIADYIENPHLKAIMKAGASLSDEELEKMRKVMESLYPYAFE